MRKLLFALTILLISSAPLFAQGSGFQVLGISPMPSSLSKADANTSVPEGAASIYSNPALLALSDYSSIDAGYSFWIANLTHGFGGVNFKNDKRAIAFAFYTAGASDYEQYDRPGESNGTFSIQHISISGAYAHDFGLFSLGAAFQFLNEQNYTYRANGYAFNAGIARNFVDDRVRTGLSITNAGEMQKLNVEATELPTSLKAGVSADVVQFSASPGDELPILISAYLDYAHPLSKTEDRDYADYSKTDPYLNMGLSLTIAETVQVSGGYKTQNNVRPVSFGAEFITNDITVNYAIIPFNTGYGTVHSIGLQYKF
ncbi:hypothetical protein [Gracilimonas mengyeensis]|uniref:PorV/PorQ family protein n=1 Tax=Gracilimonas mengyeensis TaxID=1302730 RepID=A0A521AGX2_9BACT|nr:hypothetical protein [Gracilimonas mengyeensis]SMO33988.1 hypothetical protein SAMN06265219_101119 [Gracilimonas mengyeensis]